VLRRSRWCRTSCARRAAAEATGLPGWPAAYAACCARVRASAALWERRLVGGPVCGRAGLWERRPRRDAAADRAPHRCEGAAPTLPSRLCPGLSKLLRALSLWESLVFVGVPRLCGSAALGAMRRPIKRCIAARAQLPQSPAGSAPGLSKLLRALSLWESLVFVGVPCLCGSAALGATRPPIKRCIAARAQLPQSPAGSAPGLSKLLRALSLWESLVLMGKPGLCGSALSLWERRPRRDAATDQALHRCEGAAPTPPSWLCIGPVEMMKSLVFVGAPPSARCGDRSSAASLRGRSSHTPKLALHRTCRNDEEPCLCGSAALGAMQPPIERCIAARARLPPL